MDVKRVFLWYTLCMHYSITALEPLDNRALWIGLPDPLPQTAALPVLYWPGGNDDTAALENLAVQLEDRMNAGTCAPFALVPFACDDWNADFTPWPAPALSKKAGAFTGQAPAFRAWMTARLLPSVEAAFPVSAKGEDRALIGYSLGGLFALWACLADDAFASCASCSGSLWYDGWLAYLQALALPPKRRVYLSLGDREGNARNPRMAAVDEATRATQKRLSADPAIGSCTLAWNEGGHFHDGTGRILRAMEWLFRP